MFFCVVNCNGEFFAVNFAGGCFDQYGHFFADVYDHLPLVTFLREPVSRVISHYRDFKIKYKAFSANDAKGGLPWDYSNSYPSQDINILEFAEIWPNLMTRYVKGGSFEYVGIMEEMDQCLRELGELFGFDVPRKYEYYRATPEHKKIIIEASVKREIARINREDVELYNDVIMVREKANEGFSIDNCL